MASKYYFDQEAADKAVDFIQKGCVHLKGELAGKPLMLEKWQLEIITKLFGWKRKSDNSRKHRTLFLFLPRKNGKSTLASAISLYLLFADGEAGAEVYAAAAERKQAGIIFDVARQMVMSCPAMLKKSQIFRDTILFKNSFYRVVSADAYSKAGFNSSGVIIDELFAQKNRDLYDILTTSTGSRKQPMVILISTAGYEKQNTICGEVYEYAKKVKKGIIKDPTFLPVLFEAEKKDNWEDEETWKKANPNYGISIRQDYFKEQFKKAQQQVSYQNTFKRFHLNIWNTAESKFIFDSDFQLCQKKKVTIEDFKGRECWAGLDLSTTTDLSAFVIISKDEENDTIDVIPYFWIPSNNAYKRSQRDHVDYLTWAKEGYIKMTDGDIIDYDFIEEKIKEVCSEINVVEVAYDRWNSTGIVNHLVNEGINMSPLGQGMRSLNVPTKQLEAYILGKKINFGFNPVMRWMASNMQVKVDPAGNYKPAKDKSTDRIDGMAALINAIAIYINEDIEDNTSVYEGRGILKL